MQEAIYNRVNWKNISDDLYHNISDYFQEYVHLCFILNILMMHSSTKIPAINKLKSELHSLINGYKDKLNVKWNQLELKRLVTEVQRMKTGKSDNDDYIVRTNHSLALIKYEF